MNLEFSEIKLPNPGVLKTRLPVRIFSDVAENLQKQVNSNPEKHNKNLAGHIETELLYEMTQGLKECVESTFLEYRNRFNFYPNNDYNIDTSCWVNFQKKHEYNPLHYHYLDVSWVLWISIPYDVNDEINMANVRDSRGSVASTFQFVYNKLDGGIGMHELSVDKSWEGLLIMFPAYLKHQVYPFQTSDEYRISIAGNIEVFK